ncbi:hypothetical protein [Geothermobacter hydrogeniphilus]|uniref:Uncharacterized protein n=1 Tax=Geothermobacter hydrogeniphilus TaxID=1969733 RepID=A0A1X0Y0H3_9BACT|nr:hypothetical protein [Geothermobacter hydrogeniphilus]ORJ58680.1 hypothetical protein B5V00_11295 [Geothermobacter hydrogeniphilus]
MKITCPECQKDNEFIINDETKCQYCDKPLDGYTFIKPLIPAFMLVLLTIGGARTYVHFTDENRYPAKIEYALIDQCINSYNGIMKWNAMKKKRDACISALEETQDDFSYSDFKENQRKFMAKFRQHAVANIN